MENNITHLTSQTSQPLEENAVLPPSKNSFRLALSAVIIIDGVIILFTSGLFDGGLTSIVLGLIIPLLPATIFICKIAKARGISPNIGDVFISAVIAIPAECLIAILVTHSIITDWTAFFIIMVVIHAFGSWCICALTIAILRLSRKK